MNFVTFAIKRAYWSNLKAFRGAFKYFGLTAARWEILYAIGNGYFTQAEVARTLGVCRSTVCRLVHKLEKLGFVMRADQKKDGRCFRVYLLDDAVETVLDFEDTFLRKRILLKTHGAAFDGNPQGPYNLLEALAGEAAAIAQHCGDIFPP